MPTRQLLSRVHEVFSILPRSSYVCCPGRRRNTKATMSTALSTIAAFTLTVALLHSPACGFSSKLRLASLETASITQCSRIPPFGSTRAARGAWFGRSICLLAGGDESGNDSTDKEEWRAMLASLQMYKAAYGNLEVPAKFVVPSMQPWPEAAWDLKLGQKVNQIRSAEKYVAGNQRRRKQLDKLGFVWAARGEKKPAREKAVSFDQIYDALVVYRKTVQPSGPLGVPLQFVVPNNDPWPENTRGMSLGRRFSKLDFIVEGDPVAKKKLNDIGYEPQQAMSVNDIRFQNVYTAMRRYREIYGNLAVPQPFEVPDQSPDWPESTWRLRLGARVNAIRSQGTFVKNDPERRRKLDDLGFEWNPPATETRRRGRKRKTDGDGEENSTTAAMAEQSSSEMNDDDGNDDDESDLDSFVSSFDFNSAGGDFSGEEAAPLTWGLENDEEIRDIVAAAKEEEGQQPPVVDYEPPKNLAETLAEAKQRAIEVGVLRDSPERTPRKGRRERDIPWFNDDFGDDFVFDDVVEALTLYKSFYGNFSNLTNGEFVIPFDEDFIHPYDGDGLEMLDSDASIRAAAAIARFEEIDDLAMTEDMIEAEITKLEQAMTPELEADAAVTTVALTREVSWPEHLGGMRLGNIVMRIRDGSLEVKHLPERKKQLDAIDFEWGDPRYFLDVPFEKAMCAMYAYYLVRGDMFVPQEFVMPDEEPWPTALAGFEIGKAVKRIRELQNFFEAYHPEKLGMLRMVEFVWFPTLAHPLDPNDSGMTPERILLAAFGHPNYSLMSEVPFGLPDKIVAEGPMQTVEDPHDWWRRWYSWDYVKEYWTGRFRDHAHFLRKRGFPTMADEHEEKYGPGLVTQFETFAMEVQANPPTGSEEKLSHLETLFYFRDELNGSGLNRKKSKQFSDEDRERLPVILQHAGATILAGRNFTSTEERRAYYRQITDGVEAEEFLAQFGIDVQDEAADEDGEEYEE